jgi:hypothetical protein
MGKSSYRINGGMLTQHENDNHLHCFNLGVKGDKNCNHILVLCSLTIISVTTIKVKKKVGMGEKL